MLDKKFDMLLSPEFRKPGKRAFKTGDVVVTNKNILYGGPKKATLLVVKDSRMGFDMSDRGKPVAIELVTVRTLTGKTLCIRSYDLSKASREQAEWVSLLYEP